MGHFVFVHGTGVREQRYDQLFKQVAEGVASVDAGSTVHPCYWGTDFGARLEHGRSIPDYEADGHASGGQAEEIEARWTTLDIDPVYELRVLGVRPETDSSIARELRMAVEHLELSPATVDLLTSTGLIDQWEPAVARLLSAPEFAAAIESATEEAIPERQATARALVALAQSAAWTGGGTQLSPPDRMSLVGAITAELDGDRAGIAADVLRGLAGVAFGAAALTAGPSFTWLAVRKRAAVTDASVPLAGDVLLYQTRGAALRDYIKATIESVGDDVTLVAHSLGGIACVDLLISEQLPTVSRLVTIGSQAPLLYELDALWSLRRGEPLPRHFPTWTNIYDRKDLLSYVASPVFDHPEVTDVHLDNKCAFPQSHSEYFRNPQLWAALGG